MKLPKTKSVLVGLALGVVVRSQMLNTYFEYGMYHIAAGNTVVDFTQLALFRTTSALILIWWRTVALRRVPWREGLQVPLILSRESRKVPLFLLALLYGNVVFYTHLSVCLGLVSPSVVSIFGCRGCWARVGEAHRCGVHISQDGTIFAYQVLCDRVVKECSVNLFAPPCILQLKPIKALRMRFMPSKDVYKPHCLLKDGVPLFSHLQGTDESYFLHCCCPFFLPSVYDNLSDFAFGCYWLLEYLFYFFNQFMAVCLSSSKCSDINSDGLKAAVNRTRIPLCARSTSSLSFACCHIPGSCSMVCYGC